MDAYPPAKVVWHFNGKEIKTTQKYVIIDETRKTTLRINNTQPEDSGEYTVRLANEYGDATCTTTLNIQRMLNPYNWNYKNPSIHSATSFFTNGSSFKQFHICTTVFMALSSENGCSCRPRIHARTITVNFMSLPSCNVLKVMILSLRILTEQFPYTYIFIYLQRLRWKWSCPPHRYQSMSHHPMSQNLILHLLKYQ